MPDAAGLAAAQRILDLTHGLTADDLVVYLISDESRYISGAEISVDGGEWAHGGTKVYSDLLRDMDVTN